MSEYTLVVLETSQIQSYIFNSNRLKENIGASQLVAAATEDWVKEAVSTFTAHNLTSNGFDDSKRIEDGQLAVEVLYCGGGNAVLLFKADDDARQCIRQLSRRAIEEARGLRLTFHKQSIQWDEPLSAAVSDALEKLKKQRSHQPSRTGIGGLGVTAMCASTSLPAVMMDKDPDDNWEAISAEVCHKRKASEAANKNLRKMIELPNNYRYPLDFDDLGRTKGESSFIAVVHADGNDMGQLIKDMKKDYRTSADNRKYIRAMRRFSENVKAASKAAMITMCNKLMRSIEDGEIFAQGDLPNIELKKKDGHYILPFRPLVSGGDDITFVCDGRLGIDLAVHFIEAFEKQTAQILGEKLTACAGVAIVHAHYPFARAYELAEELCKSAKLARYDSKRLNSSLLDWHYTTGGLYDELKAMRSREYESSDGKMLYLRPVFITGDVDNVQTWHQIQRAITHLQSKWGGSRSKAKGFMSALRGGDAEAQAFKVRYLDKDENLALPAIAGIADGVMWHSGRSLYYDALELMDLYFPVREKLSDVPTN
ncbi:MAG: hypothetical protein EA396_00020 [Anaerolineaceae bacterium]|nr:MAG: hypothetical protein EA396_00020 [Anaerolineaceae bacterium]